MKKILIVLSLMFALADMGGFVQEGLAKASPHVFFKNIKDGQTIANGTVVQFGVSGMKVKPAGKEEERAGHHHLIINGGSIPTGEVVPNDETHLHFGKGQTETKLNLKPGEYTLTLQFADGAHRSYGPEFSSTVKVHVK